MIKEVNFEAIYENVGTKYGDLTGVIQIDGHDNITSIYKLCEDYKIDLESQFIIGFGMNESTILGVGLTNQIYCTVLSVDKKEYGNNFEEIKDFINSNDGKLKVIKKTFPIKYSDINKYIKRYDFLVTSELTKFSNKIEIIEE